jgi:hypothetical protein
MAVTNRLRSVRTGSTVHHSSTAIGDILPMKARFILPTALVMGAAAGSIWSSIPPALSMSAEQRERVESSVYYAGCNEVRDLGKAPLYAGQPGYRIEMDGDGDGIACEPHNY